MSLADEIRSLESAEHTEDCTRSAESPCDCGADLALDLAARVERMERALELCELALSLASEHTMLPAATAAVQRAIEAVEKARRP